MPLGPDFSAQLHIPSALLGLLGSAYAVSASVAGMAGAWLLDRMDRKKALLLALFGLVLGTAAGGLAIGFKSMLLTRFLAGMFGGPATSLAISALTDVVPPERRGRAMGAMMSAFSIASVFGVPLGLWLARHGGFRLPFFVVAGLGLCICVLIQVVLPPLRDHLSMRQETPLNPLGLFRSPSVRWALLLVAVSNGAAFSIIPNLAPYLINNCGMPRVDLEYIYAIGGVCTFFSMRYVGSLIDRLGVVPITILSCIALSGVLILGFLPEHNLLPVALLFVGFMISSSSRNVCVGTACSRVPPPNERARYQSYQSAVQHFASALGSSMGSLFLHETMDGKLRGISHLSILSIVFTMSLPILISFLDKRSRVEQH